MSEEKISVDWQALWKGILANVTFMLALFLLYRWLQSFLVMPMPVGIVATLYMLVDGRRLLPAANDAHFQRVLWVFLGCSVLFGLCMAALAYLIRPFL